MPTIPRTTQRVETLLSDKTINRTTNDYHAYGRMMPGHPPPLFGQQYKFGKAEATKLTHAVLTRYEPATQKKVLKEIYARSNTRQLSKGTIALTPDAAKALTKLATQLGLTLHFGSGQARPMHPVG